MQLEGRDEDSMKNEMRKRRWTEVFRKYNGKLKLSGTGAEITGEPKPWHKEKNAETRIFDSGRPLLKQNPTLAAIGTLASACHPQIADHESAARVDLRKAEEYKKLRAQKEVRLRRLQAEGKSIFNVNKPCTQWINGHCARGEDCDFLHEASQLGIVKKLPEIHEKDTTNRRF